jgi:hypothetical protein
MTSATENAADRAIEELARSGLVLHGRTFRPAQKEITAEQHMFITTRLLKSGVAKLSFDPTAEDALGDFSTQVLLTAYESGVMWELLAGAFNEEHIPWTPSEARANAQFFANLTDPVDHAALNGALVGVLLSFLLKNVAAKMLSQKYTPGHATPGKKTPSQPTSNPSQSSSPTGGPSLPTTGSGTGS